MLNQIEKFNIQSQPPRDPFQFSRLGRADFSDTKQNRSVNLDKVRRLVKFDNVDENVGIEKIGERKKGKKGLYT